MNDVRYIQMAQTDGTTLHSRVSMPAAIMVVDFNQPGQPWSLPPGSSRQGHAAGAAMPVMHTLIDTQTSGWPSTRAFERGQARSEPQHKQVGDLAQQLYCYSGSLLQGSLTCLGKRSALPFTPLTASQPTQMDCGMRHIASLTSLLSRGTKPECPSHTGTVCGYPLGWTTACTASGLSQMYPPNSTRLIVAEVHQGIIETVCRVTIIIGPSHGTQLTK